MGKNPNHIMKDLTPTPPKSADQIYIKGIYRVMIMQKEGGMHEYLVLQQTRVNSLKRRLLCTQQEYCIKTLGIYFQVSKMRLRCLIIIQVNQNTPPITQRGCQMTNINQNQLWQALKKRILTYPLRKTPSRLKGSQQRKMQTTSIRDSQQGISVVLFT